MTRPVLIVSAVTLLLGADMPGNLSPNNLVQSPRVNAAMIQGTWKVAKAQRGGNDFPGQEKLILTIKGDKLIITEGGGHEEGAEFTIAPDRSPAWLVIKPDRKAIEPLKGICKLEGDTLTMCWAKTGDRPTQFASKQGSDHVLLVLKRVRK